MEEKIEALWQEVRELTLGKTPQISRLPHPPTPLHFLREFVSQNKPCIISAATLHWPASTLWSDSSYLRRTLSNSTVSLHLTPTGAADALTPISADVTSSLVFASADVTSTSFPAALDKILESDNKFVAYAQQQNDCLRSEYSEISGDCELDIGWASEALGESPEAVNLWIGNHLSETWFHKDHYENLYAVVTGEKHFLLLPPTDVHRMYIQDYPAAQYSYSQDSGEFKLEIAEPMTKVPWSSVDPYPSTETMVEQMSKFPLYFNGPKPFHCTVKPGEILYLPSMWFHHVRQTPDKISGLTVAVNYWYDMQFDVKYAYFSFLQSINYPTSQNKKLCALKDDDPIATEILENGHASDNADDVEEK